MYTEIKLPRRVSAGEVASEYEADGDVVELEPYVVLSERDSLSETVRKYLERPRIAGVEIIRGVPKTLGSAAMFKTPVSIGLVSEPSPGTPRDAPGGGIPMALIFATPTISRDLAGWIEKNFVK